ncbi:MAG: ABC transporter substrate-binding protein [Candidatus Rokubacteria bacterium]|nr:ABC transporter substrate-binding protein [Candidatus Rokubacteria bacterium]
MKLARPLQIGVLIGAALVLTLLGVLPWPSVAASPIKIGLITDLTGMAYLLAKDNADGAKIAVDEINKAGGVLGRPLELVVRDSALKTDMGIAAARELVVDQKVNFLLGPVSSAVRLAISDVARQYKVPMIDSIGGSRRLVEDRGHDFFFELSLTTRTEAYGQAVGTAKLKGKKVVTIAPDYEWGRLEHEGFVQPFKKMRPEAEFIGEYWPKLGEKDYTPYITAILSKNPDIIWSALWGGDFIGFVKQAKGYGVFEKFVFVGSAEPASLQALGADAPEGIYGWDRAPVYAIDTPAMKAFVAAYQAKNQHLPTGWVAFGYEAVQLVKWGLEKAGSDKPEAWVRAVKGATVPLLRGPITFREFDNVSNSPVYFGRLMRDPKYPFLILKDILKVGVEPSMISVEEVKKLREAAK